MAAMLPQGLLNLGARVSLARSVVPTSGSGRS